MYYITLQAWKSFRVVFNLNNCVQKFKRLIYVNWDLLNHMGWNGVKLAYQENILNMISALFPGSVLKSHILYYQKGTMTNWGEFSFSEIGCSAKLIAFYLTFLHGVFSMSGAIFISSRKEGWCSGRSEVGFLRPAQEISLFTTPRSMDFYTQCIWACFAISVTTMLNRSFIHYMLHTVSMTFYTQCISFTQCMNTHGPWLSTECIHCMLHTVYIYGTVHGFLHAVYMLHAVYIYRTVHGVLHR